MAGISDKALKGNYAENKYRFQKQELQNKEFSDGSGLEMYEFKYRFDDCQTGRFWSIDPLANEYVYNSPYAFSENKVTGHIELEGLEAVEAIEEAQEIAPEVGHAIAAGATATAVWLSSLKPAAGSGEGPWSGGSTLGLPTGHLLQVLNEPSPAPTIELSPSDQSALNKLNESLGIGTPNLVKTEAQKTPAQQSADKLSQKQRPGQDFTKAGAKAVRDVNKEKTGNKCANCGVQTQPGKKHVKGETPPDNESHVDHKDAKSKGGSGTPNNGQELCRKCNLDKSNN